jgi:hypothetical protein
VSRTRTRVVFKGCALRLLAGFLDYDTAYDADAGTIWEALLDTSMNAVTDSADLHSQMLTQMLTQTRTLPDTSTGADTVAYTHTYNDTDTGH